MTNIWVVSGNLGRDAEVATTKSGKTMMSFSVAVKSGFGDSAKTNWVKCICFGKMAEGKLPQYLVKGAQVVVSGECSMDEWTDKQGANKSQLKLAVSNIELVGGKREPAETGAQVVPTQPEFDDDIPF